MLGLDYLSLIVVRLRPPEVWVSRAAGLFFVFLKEGNGTCFSSAVPQPLVPGDVLVLNNDARIKLCPNNESGLVFWFFSASHEYLFPLFSCHEIRLFQTVTHLFKMMRRYPAASELAVQCHDLLRSVSPKVDLNHRSQLLRVAATILSFEIKDALPENNGLVSIEKQVSQVFEHLSIQQIITSPIDELARQFSCTRRHLNRLFHKYFGLSISALRMEMRLLKALSLLRDPDAKIIHIAEECGFNHLGLFNTCFKKRFGASPSQWRKRSSATQTELSEKIRGSSNCQLRAVGMCPWSPRSIVASADVNPMPFRMRNDISWTHPAGPQL